MLQTKTISHGDFYYGSATRGYVLDLILTEESTDQVANTSEISYQFRLRSGPANRFTDHIDCAVTIAGQTFQVADLQIWAAYNTTYTLLTGTLTVPHHDDGSLVLEASASIDTPESNPYAPPDLTFAGTMALTPIPRSSTLAATAACIGDAATIVVSRKSADYTHTLHYRFGGLSGYLADGVGNHSDTPVQLADTTVLFPIPESFYGQIPHAPTGLCTLTCTTYLGETPIGAPQTATFTVTADPLRCAPLVGGTVADTNEATLALTGSAQILVQGVSTAQCTLSAQAQHGAQIAALYVNGREISGDSASVEVTEDRMVFRAVDSRGYSAEFVVPGLSFVPYVPLSFHAEARRTDPTSGGGSLTVTGKWYPGTLGATQNALTARYRVDGGDWQAFCVDATGGDLSATAALTGLDYRTGHSLQVELSDALQTVSKTCAVSKGIPVFDWGEEDFRFHVPVRFTATDGTVFTLDLVGGQLTAIT